MPLLPKPRSRNHESNEPPSPQGDEPPRYYGRPKPVIPHRACLLERPHRADPHNENFNFILDGRIRITPVGHFHWNEAFGLWIGYGERWNRFSRTWSELRLFHCSEFECENNTMSTV